MGFLLAEGGSNEGGINRDSLDVEVKSRDEEELASFLLTLLDVDVFRFLFEDDESNKKTGEEECVEECDVAVIENSSEDDCDCPKAVDGTLSRLWKFLGNSGENVWEDGLSTSLTEDDGLSIGCKETMSMSESSSSEWESLQRKCESLSSSSRHCRTSSAE